MCVCFFIDVLNVFLNFALVFTQQFHTFSIWMVTHEAGLNELSVFNKLLGERKKRY